MLLSLSLHLLHVGRKELYSILQRAQETLFLLLHDASDKFLLSLQLRIGVAHLVYEYRQKLIHERLLLVEERVRIADGATENSADNISSLGV